jgi:hypothetical protein
VRLTPIVALVDEEHLGALADLTTARWNQIPADARRDLESLMIQNGWTAEAMVAGSLIGTALLGARNADHPGVDPMTDDETETEEP